MMNRVVYAALALLLTVGVVSCAKPPGQTEPATAAEALAVAKRELLATGRRPDDYRATVEADPGGARWIVVFDRRGPEPVPGGRHLVVVDKATRRAKFMQGE